MAVHQISILGPNTIPNGGGLCYPYPYSQWATNDVWPVIVFAFGAFANNAQPSTRIGLYGSFVVPQNYVTAAVVIPVWTATVTTGNVVWDWDYRSVDGDDTTSLDQSGTEESVSVTDAAPGAANRRLTPQLNPADANFAAGETIEFGLFRDGTDAADTMAGTSFLFDLLFQYSDA